MKLDFETVWIIYSKPGIWALGWGRCSSLVKFMQETIEQIRVFEWFAVTICVLIRMVLNHCLFEFEFPICNPVQYFRVSSYVVKLNETVC
jgi:hypothetical protein